MSDSLNATTPDGAQSYDDDTAVNMIANLDRERKQLAIESTEQPPLENGEDAAASESADDVDAAASESGEGEAAEQEEEAAAPADDAEIGAEEGEAEEEKLAHGNMRVGLRDGTITTVAHLRKLADEALEYRAKLPDLTAAAEKAKAFESREAQFAQQERLFQTIVPLAFQRLQSQITQVPNPAMLDENSPDYDPIKYIQEDQKRKNDIADLQQMYASFQEQQQQYQEKIAQEQAEEQAKRIEYNRKALLEKLPDIADPEKGKAIYEEFLKLAGTYGFTKQELDSEIDHRKIYMYYDLSRKAAAYDKIVAQKSVAATKAKSAAPVQQPGRRISQQEADKRAYGEQYKRWREGGYSEDGAVALLAMLERGRR